MILVENYYLLSNCQKLSFEAEQDVHGDHYKTLNCYHLHLIQYSDAPRNGNKNIKYGNDRPVLMFYLAVISRCIHKLVII